MPPFSPERATVERIIQFLKKNPGTSYSHAQIGKALGLSWRKVEGLLETISTAEPRIAENDLGMLLYLSDSDWPSRIRNTPCQK